MRISLVIVYVSFTAFENQKVPGDWSKFLEWFAFLQCFVYYAIFSTIFRLRDLDVDEKDD